MVKIVAYISDNMSMTILDLINVPRAQNYISGPQNYISGPYLGPIDTKSLNIGPITPLKMSIILKMYTYSRYYKEIYTYVYG